MNEILGKLLCLIVGNHKISDDSEDLLFKYKEPVKTICIRCHKTVELSIDPFNEDEYYIEWK